ncbi:MULTISPECIES: putative type IX secretion system sortase PorU2 [Niastella]|uniref:Gingipain domain-containing protein n=1 Tax=Niastella soli TaxID=2821487 RepID=A0ABS3YZV8_9BACT|nr:C25 family cysteine peptidase [Niastella soli]MBO9203293.1 hypothetical protein [Niastella soli]
MRKIFTLLLLVAGFAASSQQYNNEWINYSQTYYKIRIAKDGLYRVPKSLLDAIGIGGASVQNLELWRNGEKVPFYPSVSSGTLPSNGYIEFWGEKNDGKPDKDMYRNPAYQHTTYYSLQSDTATYFLSVNSNGSGFRYTDVNNNVAGNSLPAEDYFMYTTGTYYRGQFTNWGEGSLVGTMVYSSSYDRGEVFASGDIYPATPDGGTLNNLYLYPTGPQSSLKFGAVGTALNTRNIKAQVNTVTVKDTIMNYLDDLISNVPVDNSILSSNNASVLFFNTSSANTDRMQVSFFELTYPRMFNFDGQANFKFSLPARSAGYFLQITNFNSGGTPPVLYDRKNGERYTGDVSGGTIRFALPGSATDRQLVLVNEEAYNINIVTSATTRNFRNYLQAANQGTYIFVSNPLLYTGSNGNNPVVDYKTYRESVDGGSYKVVIADINDLVDQFAFGINKHPLSVRNFLRFARKFWPLKPSYALLIGKAVAYPEYQYGDRYPTSFPLNDALNLVPTFGWPGSDNLLSAEDLTFPVAATPIGRLSVVTGKELEDYLQKLKEYEAVQKNAPNTVAGREWMKNVVHVTGSTDAYLGQVLCNYMDIYKSIIADTLFGGNVNLFCKTSTNPKEQVSSGRLADLFEQGISILNYFGHSSTTTLEFNIDNPQNYNNQGKYPVFFVNGCYAGNLFSYYPQRFVSNETLSEKFTLAKQRGCVAFVASTHYGVVNYLNLYLNYLYASISAGDFDKSLGQTLSDAFHNMLNGTGSYDFYSRMHVEQMTLHGDPAIKINAQQKPDYVIEESLIKINPVFISLAEKSYKLKVKVENLGKAVPDSITLEIKQQYPTGVTGTVYRQKIRGIRFADSLEFDVPIVATRDKGQNKLIVTIDADNGVNEVAENNNRATKDFFIYEEEARPSYPYNYAIIHDPNQKLYASTANPLSAKQDYLMEIDTTDFFNSPLKVSQSTSTVGGVMEFNSNLSYVDSTVYYWRVAPISSDGTPLKWSHSSFMYKPGSDGYNMSHFYQHFGSTSERMVLDSASQTWKFGTNLNEIFVNNCIFGWSQNCGSADDFRVDINNVKVVESACLGHSLAFTVIDSVSMVPWMNVDSHGNPLYLYGSATSVCGGGREANFEFSYMTPTERKKIMDFMNIIPNGNYVAIRSFDADNPGSFAATWQADTTLFGTNTSLYHSLLGAGFVTIDSLYRERAWVMVYQKGPSSTFVPIVRFSNGVADKPSITADVVTPDTLGYIRSPKFGPARSWKRMEWNGFSQENPTHDNPSVDIIGIDNNGVETVLKTLDKSELNYDLSAVDTRFYPYIVLKMRNTDPVDLTPYQLKYWRVFFDPIPEGAIAPNLYIVSKDTMNLGEKMHFGIGFKNISYNDFDSMKVKVTITDAGNVDHNVPLSKFKPIIVGDTIKIDFDIDSKNYPGLNFLNVDVNPDNDQPEANHFNNFVYKNFYVRPDNAPPTLDVTFDGVHILNKDIVSAKPHIQIKIKDESTYMLLKDTTISTVQIRNLSNNSLRTYHFDNDTLRFIPASSGEDNTATIEFTPQFTTQVNPEGDDYELIVVGKDASGNKSGDVAYRVAFKVITKAMISNLLNYPNPFSTSTAFVFTLTGSEIPQNLRIQILTVTGKIVREITTSELGALHIGRNITEFKWDGTDQYGDKLANGVYLYRVITSLNGKSLDKYKASGDNTDKYFNNGYGKMYLMR